MTKNAQDGTNQNEENAAWLRERIAMREEKLANLGDDPLNRRETIKATIQSSRGLLARYENK